MINFHRIIILTILISVNLYSQKIVKDNVITDNGIIINLSFEDEDYTFEGEKNNIVNYSSSVDESKPGYPNLPSKTIFVAIPPESKIKIKLIDEKTKTINDVLPKANSKISLRNDSTLNYAETRLNKSLAQYEFYPGKKFIIEGYTWIRNYYCAVIKINTHRYNWQNRQVAELNEAKLEIKFIDEKPFVVNTSPIDEFEKSLENVILNFQQAKNFRSSPPSSSFNDSTGNWIDYSKEYVKLQIPDDGIYRITYDDIINYGIPQNVNPKTFKLYYDGNELHPFVFGEEDNSFDPGDYIEFWAEKNYRNVDYRNLVSQGEEYLTYMDLYSDTSLVWLTWDGEFGKRAEVIDEYILSLTDTINSHLVKIHLESDNLLWYYGFFLPRIQLPFWNECKTWIWQQVNSSGTSSFPFISNSIVPNTQVYTISRLNSWATTAGLRTNAHKYGAKLNSTGTQDSVIFDFETIANLEAVFSSDDLIAGTNNYRIAGMPNDSGFTNKALVDWIDIEYYQFTDAVNDSLLITIPDSVSKAMRVIEVENYNSTFDSTVIYKIEKSTKRVATFLINNNVLSFTDTVSGGDKYFIIKKSYLKQPIFLKKKQFVNLRNQSRQADYLLITHNSLQQSANDYANFIESNYNLSTATVFTEDIYDEFGYGYLKPESIKEFSKYAYFNWQNPKPAYLVLLGDGIYDYKNLFALTPSQRKKNLVPSYGNPVSDVWFTTWDTTNINIQQMFVGRIPANNNEEVYRYLQKHQTYVQREFDEWNKNFMLFSGGFPSYPSEMEQIKQANERVLTNVIQPSPVGGSAIHFYKTISPPTNFGPYTQEEIQNGLDKGGLFISYVGHSGTRTWDNGVSDPVDIQNAFQDRLPVISDNGCSTGKFAEPDIDAFGELFLNQDEAGQAIAYLGNSSLGYTSTAFRMPEVFYKRLAADTTMNIGETHFLAKMDNFNQAGFSDVNRLYNYCNILLGDPVIEFAFPDKPNFVVNQNSVKFLDEFITDTNDSIDIKLIISNWGKVVDDSLQVDIEGVFSDSTIYLINKNTVSPFFNDTLNLRIPILNLAGEHIIKVDLDKDNLIDEVSEIDNAVEIQFIVFSTKLRPIEAELFYNTSRTSAKILNPVLSFNNQLNDIEIALSQDADFTNQKLFSTPMDSVATRLSFNNLLPSTRYYWRARLEDAGQEWSQSVSFYNNENYSWFINNSFNAEDITSGEIEFDTLSAGWKLKRGVNNLKIGSAGFNDGKYASIQYNFIEFVPNTFFRGFATALIDTFDLHPYDVQIFETSSRDSMVNYLDFLQEGSILAIAAADEVSIFFSGATGDSLRILLKGFGSAFVDSIGWRDSWSMIGVKGAAQGTVAESFSKSLQGPAVIDTSKFVQFTYGTIQFPVIANSVKWLSVFKDDSIPNGALVNYYPVAYKNDGSVDTLQQLNFSGNEASVEFIDAEIYKKISLLAELTANTNSESPKLKSLAVNFIPPPELAINFQVVSVPDDTVMIGEDVNLHFAVYNVGETTAGSFKVLVDVINENNQHETIFEQIEDSLSAGDKNYFDINYNTSSGSGNKTFLINVDSDNQVTELFEDNNFYTAPFFIEPDTTTPTLKITFDGNDILDGDYISTKPEITIELSDPSLLPVTDPSSVMIFLNNVEIPSDTSIINYEFSETNPKVVVTFNPELVNGEYYLNVFAKDASGNLVDSSGVERYFLVSDEAKILYVYNYPNPFAGETYFTFKLTQIPDEIKIKIFTIAGRLIKKLKINPDDLNYDFNKIYWDGRDEDGDLPANGVYLYKIIMRAGDKTEEVTQKLAIVR